MSEEVGYEMTNTFTSEEEIDWTETIPKQSGLWIRLMCQNQEHYFELHESRSILALPYLEQWAKINFNINSEVELFGYNKGWTPLLDDDDLLLLVQECGWTGQLIIEVRKRPIFEVLYEEEDDDDCELVLPESDFVMEEKDLHVVLRFSMRM
eukprot:TRINITY_DN3613_c0_g1_i1.p1 TRINITY_DN3613_c0_g1~~TRINITY_DN3613_c0_g1_i1.p1  ORF type:complete len:171 (+),score=39.94 TRINITY_DN3613_c0_g1_i1:60-515(+)